MTTMTISLTRWGQSCVGLEGPDGALVIDPGVYGAAATALSGADGVLLTHEHADHVDGAVVAASGLPVWGPAPALAVVAVAGADASRLHEVHAGDTLTVGGLEVRVVGERHAVIHPDVPLVPNVGYLVAGVLHPGDAFVESPDDATVEVALVPISGPWLRMADAIDWVRAVQPARAVPIHDVMLSETGMRSARDWLSRLTPAAVVTPAQGEAVEV